MRQLNGIVAGLCALALAACGQNIAEEESVAEAPDAENPYAAPTAPPSHAATETTPGDIKSVAAASDAPDGLPANVAPSENGKVNNVTSTMNDAAKDAIKNVAAAGDEALKSPAGGEDTFGALVGDADRGKRLFVQCQACHSVQEGRNGIGPTLYDIVGRQAGSIEGVRYSDANAQADIEWTEDALFAFMENPRDYMPGTRMVFVGVKREQDRADIVAYLKSVSPSAQ